MQITNGNLEVLFGGFKANFKTGFDGAPSHYSQVATTVPSGTREENYAWLGQIPRLREWIGDRHVKRLILHGYKIANRDFELTLSVPANDIEDDQYGVWAPLFEEMGRSAREQPDELVFDLLKQGASTLCYDGQNFFDTDHPVEKDGETVSVSNFQAGAGPTWYLLDTSRPLKPLIFQERKKPVLVSRDDERDSNVFDRREFLYGVHARHNVGFGLWQTAYASKAALTPANYAAARTAMHTLRGDENRLLGIRPNLLLVPPELESDGRKIVSNALGEGGVTNEWAGTAEIIVSPWLAE